MINKFNYVKNPKVVSTHDIDDVLNIIKNGDENLETVKAIRSLGKSNILYNDLKKTKLPTYRFNFNFEGIANNDNIIKPTGFIYLDVDKCNSLQLDNDYVYAYWKSLSNTGYSILVKVEGLNKSNFSNTYFTLGRIFNLTLDKKACKPTQQTVLSFDSNLFHNPNSSTFKAVDKKVSNAIIKKKENEGITTNDTFSESSTIRFSNINDYFVNNDVKYIYYKEEKENISQPYIPKRVGAGSRNSTMFYVLGQYALLNPSIGENYLISWAKTINQNVMHPRLSENEIQGIVKSVMKKRFEKTLNLNLNKPRRIIFNPSHKMNHKEKMKITNTLIGATKKETTKQAIYNTIEDWNFENHGKITQKKVAEASNRSIATIKRYWNDFKDYVSDLNNSMTVNTSASQPLLGINYFTIANHNKNFIKYEDLMPNLTNHDFLNFKVNTSIFDELMSA